MVKLLKSVKENFLFLGIAFLLFFIPAYPKLPLFAVPETYVSIRVEDLLIAFVVGVFVLQLILRREFSLFRWPLTQIFFLFFGIGLLSDLSGIFITKNISTNLALLHWLRRVEYTSLLFVAYYSFKKTKQLKFFAIVVLIALLGVIVYGLGQKFFGWPVISTMNKEFSKGMILRLTWWARINSSFAGHYDLAAYMVMILNLCTVVIMIVKKWWQKIIIFIFALFSYYLLVLTASRISFGAYLVSIIFVLILAKKKLIVIPFLIFSLLGMLLSADLGQRYAATFKIDLSFMSGLVKINPSDIALAPTLTPIPTATPTEIQIPTTMSKSKVLPTFTPTPTPTPTTAVASGSGMPVESTELAVGRSTDIRLKVEWPRAIRAFLKNPLLGTGYSSITLATDNDYLRLLGEVGLLGLLSLLAIFLEIGRKFYFFLFDKRSLKTEKLIVLGIAGASIGYFFNATFIDVFEASKIAFFFWILMGIGLRVIDLNNNKEINE